MDPPTSEALSYFKKRLLEEGEPVALNRLLTFFVSDPSMKKLRKTILGSSGKNSLEGWGNFLAEHPSIFIIKDGLVGINPHEDDHDYIQEAKEYFEQKLMHYGTGKIVPITTLFGHRCQASLEIRYFSGKFIEDFTDFLTKHRDTFDVYDGSVTLVDKSDKNLEEYNHWAWKNGPLQQMISNEDTPTPVPPKVVVKQKPKHHAKHVPRKVSKYEIEDDFNLKKFCE